MTDKYVTVAGAGTKAGTSWANAFGLAEWESDVPSASAGDIYWIAGGTYTLTTNLETSNDGTLASRISLMGVNAGTTNEPPIITDLASGTNRPLFSSTYRMTFDNYWKFRYLRIVSSSTSYCLRGDMYLDIYGCYIENTSTGYGLQAGSSAPWAINNEIISTSGTALYASAAQPRFLYNYIHDSVKGLDTGSSGSNGLIEANIFDTCTTALDIGATHYHHISGNTFYSGTLAMEGTATSGNIIINNTISGFVDGIKFTTPAEQILIDYNNYYGISGDDVTGVTKGPNATAVDPQFTDAPNGDFSLDGASGLIGAGMGIQLGVG